LFLSADEVSDLFDADLAIESQRVAFTALGNATAIPSAKAMMPNPADSSVAFCYVARLAPGAGAVCKFGSVNPGNPAQGLPSITAMIMVLDPETGQPLAIMDGTVITTRRTAAASAVAVSALAASRDGDLAVLGYGTQGREHIRMISRVIRTGTIRLWGPSDQRCAVVARDLSAETGLSVLPCGTAREAVSDADVVALCTLSSTPVLSADWLAPGATVVAVGSFEPTRHEVGPDVVRAAARVVVDDPATAAAHAGPVVDALLTGLLGQDDLVGIGDVLVGSAVGRVRADEIIYYNSTGIGVQDAAAATAVIDRARRESVGQTLTR
jgi:ornithine cyclodeaminase